MHPTTLGSLAPWHKLCQGLAKQCGLVVHANLLGLLATRCPWKLSSIGLLRSWPLGINYAKNWPSNLGSLPLQAFSHDSSWMPIQFKRVAIQPDRHYACNMHTFTHTDSRWNKLFNLTVMMLATCTHPRIQTIVERNLSTWPSWLWWLCILINTITARCPTMQMYRHGYGSLPNHAYVSTWLRLVAQPWICIDTIQYA